MEAPWIEEAEVPSRGLSKNRSRPSPLESVPPGAMESGRGDRVLAGAETLRPAEDNAVRESGKVAYPSRVDSA